MARELHTRTTLFFGVLALAALLGATGASHPAQAADAAPAPETAPAAAAEPAAAPAPAQDAGQVPVMSGQAATASKQAAAAVAPESGTPPPPPLTPMQAEIRQLLDGEQAAVAQLQARLTQAVDSAEALAIQKQVQQTKLQAQIGILQIQARYARAEGREAVAVQLETAIREMTTPRLPGKPIDRPAPAQSPNAGTAQH